MARKRMIDPNFWGSEDIAKLSILARYIFIGMFSNADDEGRGRANSNYLKSTIFPYDDIRTAEIDKALSEISHNTSVVLYDHAGNKYYAFTNWSKWQKVEKPYKSMLPCPNLNNESFGEDSGNNRGTFGDESRLREEKRIQENIYSRVVTHLNQKAGTQYRHTTPKTQVSIRARTKEGFTFDDFMVVIDAKVAEWKGTDMGKYLRPETLFGTKFEGYLNQAKIKSPEKSIYRDLSEVEL